MKQMRSKLPILLLIFVFLFSCEPTTVEPDDNNNNNDDGGGGFVTDPVTVTGGESLDIIAEEDIVSDITDISATITGEFTQLDSDEKIIKHGHIYSSVNSHPDIDNSRTMLGERTTLGTFVSEITGLEPDTKYYVRSYVVTEKNRIGYHPVIKEFTTDNPASNIILSNSSITNDNINNNGIANPGENITYSVSLKNIGNKNAENVSVTISCDNSNVSNITPNSIDYSNIAVNEIITKTFSLQLSNTTDIHAVIPVTIEVTDQVNNWTYSFDIEVEPLYPAMDNLIAYYRFDEQNINDFMGNYNGNATNITFTSETPGTNGGYSAIFSGNSYFRIFDFPDATSTWAYSINTWIKTSTGTGTILSSTNAYSNRTILQGNLRVGQYILFADGISSALADNNWHMLTITIGRPNTGSTQTEFKAYVDGSVIGTTSPYVLDGVFIFDNTITIGANIYMGTDNYLNGELDNYRLYNKILTNTEIQEIYNARE